MHTTRLIQRVKVVKVVNEESESAREIEQNIKDDWCNQRKVILARRQCTIHRCLWSEFEDVHRHQGH